MDPDHGFGGEAEFRGVVADAAFEDEADVADDGRGGGEVAVEHDEVGAFADGDGAASVEFAEDLGAIGRHDLDDLDRRETGFDQQFVVPVIAEAGFTPVEAIKIMSANGAQVLREINQRGTITVGKQADLVVLDGDLPSTPSVIRNVRLVFRDGIGYDAPKLRLSAKAMVGIQ